MRRQTVAEATVTRSWRGVSGNGWRRRRRWKNTMRCPQGTRETPSCRHVTPPLRYDERTMPSCSCCRPRGGHSLIFVIALISPPPRGTTNDFVYRPTLSRSVTSVSASQFLVVLQTIRLLKVLHRLPLSVGSGIMPLLVFLLLFFFLLLLGQCCPKRTKAFRLRHFKSDRDKVWQGCSSSKYASIDGVGFLICSYTFKLAAVTSAPTAGYPAECV